MTSNIALELIQMILIVLLACGYYSLHKRVWDLLNLHRAHLDTIKLVLHNNAKLRNKVDNLEDYFKSMSH